MPIEIGIWRLNDGPHRLSFSTIETEDKLEELIAKDISILDPSLLLIGRQVPTAHGTFMDLLAIDKDGKLVAIELKRNRTPREVVAQLLDYGSWVRELQDSDIAAIFDGYLKKYKTEQSGMSLNDAFLKKFYLTQMPDSLNENHELVIVAGELDNSTERIINYLSDEYGVAVNAVFFRFLKDEDREYLSRVWLIDPTEVETKAIEKHGQEPWNGEFYVSHGEHEEHRLWSNARKYGYVSAGFGKWYTQTLELLEKGERVWVNVPGRGYVGVGTVLDKVKPITEFMIQGSNNEMLPITAVVKEIPETNKSADELEYFVRVKWLKTVPLEDAVKEKGFFGNQNTVAKPKSKKWIHTVERLKKRWNIT